MGHRFEGAIYEFPHVCPGDECAIARWLLERHYRTQQVSAAQEADYRQRESTRCA